MDRVVRLAVRSKVEIRFDGTKHSASGIPSNLSSMEQRHWPESDSQYHSFESLYIYFLALTFNNRNANWFSFRKFYLSIFVSDYREIFFVLLFLYYNYNTKER